MEKILVNEEELVSAYTEDKIYLNLSKMFITDHGLVVRTNENEEISLPFISSDCKGCFIKVAKDTYFPTGTTYWCYNCGKMMPVDGNGSCIRCGTKIKHSK